MDLLAYFISKTSTFPGKWRVVNLWTRTLKKGNVSRVAYLPHGIKVKVDLSIPYERMVYLQAEEWDELIYLNSKLKAGDTFIDVGANIGLWTLVAARSVGISGKVYSFEPNPSTYQKLKDNVLLNNVKTIVESKQAAVSDTSGSVFFNCAAEHNVSSIADSKAIASDTISVPSIKLDALLGDQRIDGIKIDTEGYELSVLKGAANLLTKQRPFLIVEFNTTLLESSLLGDWDVYQYLKQIGYSPFIYNKSGEERPIDHTFSVNGYVNILFNISTANA